MRTRIAGFIILIIGVVLSVLLLKSMWHDFPAWIFGRRVPAVIEEIWWEDFDLENRYSKDELHLKYMISYKFTTTEGEVVLGKSKVTEDEFLTFMPGKEVMIKYSRINPEDNRLDDSRYVPFLVFTYIPFILVCLFTLVAGREMIDF